MPDATPSDMYMNFLDASITLGANSSTLAESVVNTGLSIRSGHAFLIHMVELLHADGNVAASENLKIALATRANLATLPDLGDTGVICGFHKGFRLTTSGGAFDQGSPPNRYLPPIPLAAPKIVTYAQTDADEAAFQSLKLQIRVGFTTVKIDSKLYTELAETWGFAN